MCWNFHTLIKMRLNELANASRHADKFVKEFSSKHQRLFQKVLHLFKKVLSSVSAIIFVEETRKKYRKTKERECVIIKTPYHYVIQSVAKTRLLFDSGFVLRHTLFIIT